MDKNLYFLTKSLVDEAVLEINKKGIPPKRKGRGYLVSIGNEKYPFKLIVTEAAKIAGINLTSKDFSSSETNRNGFQKITDYPIINLGGEMEYFDLKQIAEYKKEVGKQYDSSSPGAKCYNNTRLKLQYLGRQLGELFSVDLINNYNEKPNKMAGQGKGFVQKEYILTGFIPKIYHEKGNQIFIKLVFAGFTSELCFGIDIDVNFSDDNNPFNHNRKALQNESQWKIKVDENFPTNWEDLLDVISPVFEKQLKIINAFFLQKNKVMELNNLAGILEYKKQIILQGPPGTGKTREAKLIAKQMLGLVDVNDLKDNDQFKLIQFHPSYTYEDFVRGIISESKGDQIEYKNVNKTLGLIAEKALKNFRNSKKVPELISKEIWVEENYLKFKENLELILEQSGELMIKENTKPKITAIEDDAVRVNRYSNEKDSVLIKDSDIINGYIGLFLVEPIMKLKDNFLLSKSARSGMYYLYQNLIGKFKEYLEEKNLTFKFTNNFKQEELKKYILVIDEINRANLSSVLGELIYALEYRGEVVESIYNVEGNELILPPNLYIIGTMNTADRSVGHIDYAIRRRFAFVDVLPKNLSEEGGITFDSVLFSEVARLFETNLSTEFEKNQVQLGHSYFIDKSAEGAAISIRLQYEIKPILLEYVKDGVLVGDGIQKKIQELATSI